MVGIRLDTFINIDPVRREKHGAEIVGYLDQIYDVIDQYIEPWRTDAERRDSFESEELAARTKNMPPRQVYREMVASYYRQCERALLDYQHSHWSASYETMKIDNDFFDQVDAQKCYELGNLIIAYKHWAPKRYHVPPRKKLEEKASWYRPLFFFEHAWKCTYCGTENSQKFIRRSYPEPRQFRCSHCELDLEYGTHKVAWRQRFGFKTSTYQEFLDSLATFLSHDLKALGQEFPLEKRETLHQAIAKSISFSIGFCDGGGWYTFDKISSPAFMRRAQKSGLKVELVQINGDALIMVLRELFGTSVLPASQPVVDVPKGCVPRIFAVGTSSRSAGFMDFLGELSRPARSVVRPIYLGGDCSDLAIQVALPEQLEAGDILALVRGGGDLSHKTFNPFNNLKIATFLAELRQKGVIVVAGVGHSTDETEVKRVATVAAKLPALAAHVVNDLFLALSHMLNRGRGD